MNNIFRSISLDCKLSSLADKFKGCLMGALIGDCFGRPYRLSDEVSLTQLQKYFDKLDGPYFKAPYKSYSSNSALTRCLAESLVTNNKFDALDTSKRFVKEFFTDPNRDYGSNLCQIFFKLRGSKFQDPFGPAQEQHLGLGSYGNSAATRAAPLALFYMNNSKEMVKAVKDMANITNAHSFGRDGAILQSCAVRNALYLDATKCINTENYLNKLISDIKEFIVADELLDLTNVKKYEEQLHLVDKLLKKGATTEYDVVSTLGHAKVAVFSVPTAIYCFLRSFNEIPGIETSNQLRRTVQYATSLGGDTQSIASMAGALAGVYCGINSINDSLQRHCEGLSSTLEIGEKMAKLTEINVNG